MILASIAPAEPRLTDRRGAAKYLGGLCAKTIANLVKRGELPEVRIAGRALYDLADLDKLIDQCKRGGSATNSTGP